MFPSINISRWQFSETFVNLCLSVGKMALFDSVRTVKVKWRSCWCLLTGISLQCQKRVDWNLHVVRNNALYPVASLNWALRSKTSFSISFNNDIKTWKLTCFLFDAVPVAASCHASAALDWLPVYLFFCGGKDKIGDLHH